MDLWNLRVNTPHGPGSFANFTDDPAAFQAPPQQLPAPAAAGENGENGEGGEGGEGGKRRRRVEGESGEGGSMAAPAGAHGGHGGHGGAGGAGGAGGGEGSGTAAGTAGSSQAAFEGLPVLPVLTGVLASLQAWGDDVFVRTEGGELNWRRRRETRRWGETDSRDRTESR